MSYRGQDAAGAVSLADPTIWQLSDTMGPWRLTAATVLASAALIACTEKPVAAGTLLGIGAHRWQTAGMVAILVTGMSGVGKTTALEELARRGFHTVDTDDETWIEIVHGEPLWREERIDALLAAPRTGALFVQGTVANQWRFYDRFGAIVLLSAPVEVILERVRTRTNNGFGKNPEDRDRMVRDIAETEPLLRSAASHELDTSRPLREVVEALIGIAQNR